MSPRWGLLVAILYFIGNLRWTDGISVMSVDFGSEWIKVAIVSPRVPMEIALNKESKRKTPAHISFRDGERTFGEDAQNVAVRFPKNGYGYLLDLLGKKVDHPIVQLYKKRFPYYNIVEDPERGTVIFQHDSDTQFSPEELIGMLLHKAKEFAEESAGQPITDAVLIAPGYFNQAERQALLNAAGLAGIKVLQLMNDYTAVALNYGIFRRKDFNETAQYVMFYDMGASSSTATLVSYQMVKYKDRSVVETNPQATVLGVGYDRTLGGLEMQLRLQQYLAKKFNEIKKTKSDVFSNPRAMAKLFKEAGRLKNVLSANADHYAQVEGLLDEEDFKLHVTRETFEDLCKDLFARVGKPIQQALDNAGLSIEIVSQVILVGGGTRVPMVQDTLQKFVKMELSKNINTDEAAVMGGAYRAADMSAGFKVKKFITKDAVIFPIQVSYERETESGEIKQQKRTLFGSMNAYPQKKMITFNKYSKDFGFLVHYGELDHLPKEEIAALGPTDLAQVSLSGVEDAVKKHNGPKVEPKGVKAHFSMDESGILSLVNVDYVVEKIGGEEPSTLQKIGSGLSKLFGAAEEPVLEPPLQTDSTETEDRQDENGTKIEKDAVNNTTDEKKTSESAAKNDTEKVDKKPKIVTVKEVIQSNIQELGVQRLSVDQYGASQKKIDTLNEFDTKKQKKEQAQNQLESFLFDAKNKLDLPQYDVAASEDEKASIQKACTEISTWLDEEGFDADASTYEDKLSQLKSLTGPWLRRVREHEERPEALNALHNKLEAATGFASAIRTNTKEALDAGEETVFTTVEIDVLDKLITETKEWKQKMEAEQNALPLYTSPTLTIRSIVEKLAALDREVNYLMNKAKIWRPTKKVNETKVEGEKIKESNATVTEGEDNESIEAPEVTEPPEETEPTIVEIEDESDSDTKEEPVEAKESTEEHQEL